jgi:hypothetical protein
LIHEGGDRLVLEILYPRFLLRSQANARPSCRHRART